MVWGTSLNSLGLFEKLICPALEVTILKNLHSL